MRLRTRRWVAPLCLALLASCGRDAANEDPVMMKGGMYTAKMSGSGTAQLRQAGPGTVSDDICLGAGEEDAFPGKVLENYLSAGGSCHSEGSERKGNLITGKIICPMDAEDAAGGSLAADYSATIGEEALDAAGLIKVDFSNAPEEIRGRLEQSGLGKGVQFQLTAKRTGDC